MKLLIVTGETSGDLHGANVIRELKGLIPDLKVFGIGGERLKKEGVEIVCHIKFLAVVGFLEVIPKFFRIRKAMQLLYTKMLKEKPDACLLIDYPGFNLRFAKLAKQEGIKVIYYILPQIWAWGRGRLKSIYNYVDKGIAILPFEPKFYEKLNVEFVGHPLLDSINDYTINHLTNQPFNQITIALLPGSRVEEIKQILPIMLKCVKKLPNFNFTLPVAPEIDIKWIEKLIHGTGIKVVKNNTYEVLSNSSLALVASGTATLEACVLEVPMIIIYKVSLISYILGRLLIKIPWIGLVNIIANEKIVPEFIQFNTNPKRIINSVNKILSDPRPIISKLSEVKDKLGTPGASRRAAQIIYKTLTK
ncbi:lipid-A-disaccharide synthase [candidate division WOR-3 bacterium]|nr:lipid-A-disaccharide synthase [candidate division WOR-3 bacterium]